MLIAWCSQAKRDPGQVYSQHSRGCVCCGVVIMLLLPPTLPLRFNNTLLRIQAVLRPAETMNDGQTVLASAGIYIY